MHPLKNGDIIAMVVNNWQSGIIAERHSTLNHREDVGDCVFAGVCAQLSIRVHAHFVQRAGGGPLPSEAATLH